LAVYICDVCDIIGTGTNACYVEQMDKVEKWDGDDQPPKQVRERNRLID